MRRNGRGDSGVAGREAARDRGEPANKNVGVAEPAGAFEIKLIKETKTKKPCARTSSGCCNGTLRTCGSNHRRFFLEVLEEGKSKTRWRLWFPVRALFPDYQLPSGCVLTWAVGRGPGSGEKTGWGQGRESPLWSLFFPYEP